MGSMLDRDADGITDEYVAPGSSYGSLSETPTRPRSSSAVWAVRVCSVKLVASGRSLYPDCRSTHILGTPLSSMHDHAAYLDRVAREHAAAAPAGCMI